MLNIGIIGLGDFSIAHAKAILEVSGLFLKAVCRTNEKKLNQFCSEYDVIGYTDYKELLKNKNIDIVLISTPHHLHTKFAIEAAKAGKHILVEKPMAPSVEECQQIIDAAQHANVKLMIGQTLRFHPASLYAEKIIKQSEIGSIIMGTATLTKCWINGERKPWHLEENSYGGVLRTLGIHYIDILNALMKSNVISVVAHIKSAFNDYKIDDTVMLLLRYENGVESTILCVGYKQGFQRMEAEIYCKEGILKIDYLNGVYLKRNEEEILKQKVHLKEGMHIALCNQWQEFRAAIIANRTPSVSGKEGAHGIAIIEAAIKSAKLRKEIFLN